MSALGALLLLLAQAGGVTHTAHVAPAAASVGEPLEVVCEVEHPADLVPRPLAPELDPSAPFVFLDSRREPVRAVTFQSIERTSSPGW